MNLATRREITIRQRFRASSIARIKSGKERPCGLCPCERLIVNVMGLPVSELVPAGPRILEELARSRLVCAPALPRSLFRCCRRSPDCRCRECNSPPLPSAARRTVACPVPAKQKKRNETPIRNAIGETPASLLLLRTMVVMVVALIIFARGNAIRLRRLNVSRDGERRFRSGGSSFCHPYSLFRQRNLQTGEYKRYTRRGHISHARFFRLNFNHAIQTIASIDNRVYDNAIKAIGLAP